MRWSSSSHDGSAFLIRRFAPSLRQRGKGLSLLPLAGRGLGEGRANAARPKAKLRRRRPRRNSAHSAATTRAADRSSRDGPLRGLRYTGAPAAPGSKMRGVDGAEQFRRVAAQIAPADSARLSATDRVDVFEMVPNQGSKHKLPTACGPSRRPKPRLAERRAMKSRMYRFSHGCGGARRNRATSASSVAFGWRDFSSARGGLGVRPILRRE